MRHFASRGLLAVLSAFLAITTISGAIVVVPNLPAEWLDGSIFDDYTVPAFALGFVGGLAVVTLIALAIRTEVAGGVGVATGLAMIAFELVEIWAVGFSLTEYGADEPFAWLQVVYIGVGALTVVTGLALWRATANSRKRLARRHPTAASVHG